MARCAANLEWICAGALPRLGTAARRERRHHWLTLIAFLGCKGGVSSQLCSITEGQEQRGFSRPWLLQPRCKDYRLAEQKPNAGGKQLHSTHCLRLPSSAFAEQACYLFMTYDAAVTVIIALDVSRCDMARRMESPA